MPLKTQYTHTPAASNSRGVELPPELRRIEAVAQQRREVGGLGLGARDGLAQQQPRLLDGARLVEAAQLVAEAHHSSNQT